MGMGMGMGMGMAWPPDASRCPQLPPDSLATTSRSKLFPKLLRS